MMLEDAVFIQQSEEKKKTDVDYNLDLSLMCVMSVMSVIRCYNY